MNKDSWRNIGYYIRQNRPMFSIWIILFLVIFMSIFYTRDNLNWWTDLIDPFIGLATFIVAIIIAFQNYDKKVKDSFQKRMTVHFAYNEKVIMSCYDAILVSQSAIREWGMQIGSQMAAGKRLDLEPHFDIEQPQYTYPQKRGEFGKALHTITFYLRQLPVDIAPGVHRIWRSNEQNRFDKEDRPLYNPSEPIALTLSSEKQTL